MENIKEILQARQKYLLQMKADKEKQIKNAPDGTLRVCNNGGRIQFYHRIEPTDCCGRYINERELPLVKSLAEKDYDKKLLRAIERELNAIKKYFDTYPATNVEQIYEKLHKERQKLVNPIVEPKEEFIRKWVELTYEGKGFQEDAPEFYTMKGERVRSKSELIIADILNREGIPYRYECPVYLSGYGRVYPDFTVLNVKSRKEIYWEHFGMMDDPVYAENALKKIATYENNGIFPGDRLLLTYETKNMPISQKKIRRIIQQYM